MPSNVPPGPTLPPGNDWDPESAGLLRDDGKFICGYPLDWDRRCQRVVGEEWSPCWQHEEVADGSD